MSEQEIDDLLLGAHKKSMKNQKEVMGSEICGCFYCLKTFVPTKIEEWEVESGGEKTPLCPGCGIDSVLGSSQGFPITEEFLKKMQSRFF